MSRYSKIASKYILSKFHQDSSQGTIYERDWTTIGNIHRLEPGKRPYYGSSGFLFTDSTIPAYKKKRKTGKWVGEYTYEDVKDAESVVNLIKVNSDSENLCNYAYWGSMTELFRGSVEHIIKTFPGRLRSTKRKLRIHHHQPNENNGVEWWDEASGYILANPFEVDMHTTEVQAALKNEELLKYVALSWRKYNVEDYESGETRPIESYSVYEDYIEYDCELKYFRLYNIVLFYNKCNFLIIDVYLADGKIVYVYRTDEDDDVPPWWFDFVITYYSGLAQISSGGLQQDTDDPNANENNFTNADIDDIFENWYVPEDFGICPKREVIEYYFHGLEGFEWKLLNRRTNPYYRNTFLLPVQQKNGNWRLIRRTYTWPSEGVWIDIESLDFDSFITSMVDLCNIYDNLWCDSIWRCMVHESIKNFDWSYRREYDENDERDNIEGGNQMKDVMRLYGIFYDRAKRLVDGITMCNKVTYDGYDNCPNAQISDRNLLQGWDIVSTQHTFYWYEGAGRVVNYENYVSMPALPINVDESSPEFVAITCTGLFDTQYYRKKMLLVSDVSLDNYFFEYGGQSGLIVQKQDNPWISTNIYNRLYVEVPFSSIPSSEIPSLNENILYEFPYKLDGDSYPQYVCVLNNKTKKYYKLLEGSAEIEANNEKYVNNVWFQKINENSITPATTDILFNRELNLSSNRILKTKGTKEAIDMAFGLFGFGKYDAETNPYGDYIIEEQYNNFIAKRLNETFYFYEIIDESDAAGHNPTVYSELPKNASEDSYEYIVVTNQSFDTYYKLNGMYTVAEAVKLLYAHRITERVYDDYYSGVPLNETVVGNNHLVIPFFDSNKQYEGNLFYEANGGWMNTGLNSWDYSETIPYLHILQRISDLFTVNTNDAKNGDMYYVADVSDYYDFTDDVPYYLSNFFKLKDKYNSGLFSSWVNVPIEGPIQNGGYSGIQGVTREDYLHAKHLDNIIPSVLFNNPHVGYDKYDMGSEFVGYLETPYKFSADNYLYDDDYYQNMAKQFTFMYRTKSLVGGDEADKVGITATTVRFDENRQTTTTNHAVATNTENGDDIFEIAENDKFLKITLLENGVRIYPSQVKYRMHLEYMRNVVLKYVAQVIPSTTLIVLENFEVPETISTDMVTINAEIIGEGVVYGTGDYLKSSMVTLNAVPSEGFHFKGWRDVYGRTIQPQTPDAQLEPEHYWYENTLTVMACEDSTYTAVFVEDCEAEFGCKIVKCSTPDID